MMSSFHGKTSSFLSCKTNLNHLNHNLNIANWPGGRSIGPWWGVSSPSSRDLLSFPTRTTTCNSTATWSLVRFSQLTYLWMSEVSGLENLTIRPCKLVIGRMIQVKRTNQNNKHRKNCECCPGHSLIVNHYSSISWFKFRNLSVIVNCVSKSLIH